MKGTVPGIPYTYKSAFRSSKAEASDPVIIAKRRLLEIFILFTLIALETIL